MVKTRAKWMVALTAAALALGLPSAAFAAGVKFKATLTGTPIEPAAFGEAEWELNTQTGQIVFKAAVQDVVTTNLAMVVVNKRFVGFMPIVGGIGQLDLDNFLGDKIPRVTNGTPIEIRRASDGATLLTGTFVPKI